MKVRCVRIVNPITLQSEPQSPWLTVGEEYLVLELAFEPERPAEVRILAPNDQQPGLWDSRMFVTTDPSLPANWICAIEEGGRVELGPASWLRRGFWEDYFDGDEEASEDFERELNVMQG